MPNKILWHLHSRLRDIDHRISRPQLATVCAQEDYKRDGKNCKAVATLRRKQRLFNLNYHLDQRAFANIAHMAIKTFQVTMLQQTEFWEYNDNVLKACILISVNLPPTGPFKKAHWKHPYTNCQDSKLLAPFPNLQSKVSIMRCFEIEACFHVPVHSSSIRLFQDFTVWLLWIKNREQRTQFRMPWRETSTSLGAAIAIREEQGCFGAFDHNRGVIFLFCCTHDAPPAVFDHRCWKWASTPECLPASSRKKSWVNAQWWSQTASSAVTILRHVHAGSFMWCKSSNHASRRWLNLKITISIPWGWPESPGLIGNLFQREARTVLLRYHIATSVPCGADHLVRITLPDDDTTLCEKHPIVHRRWFLPSWECKLIVVGIRMLEGWWKRIHSLKRD